MTMTESRARTGLPEPRRTGLVPVSEITRDERVNTRPINWAWVADHSGDNFHPEALGVLAVSVRDDGTIVVLNGQHRAEVVRASGGGDREIECQVYEGLNLAEEAGLVVLLNDNRALTAVHKFLARITEGDPVATDIKRIAELCSFKIGDTQSPGMISCVQCLEQIHRADLKRKEPQRALERTLRAIAHAWAHSPGATNTAVIGGIGDLFLRYGDRVNDLALVSALKGGYDTPATLRGNAIGLRAHLGGPVKKSVRQHIIGTYNAQQGRSGGKLPSLLR